MEIRELLQAYKKGLLSEEEAARALTYSDLGLSLIHILGTSMMKKRVL